MVGAGRPARGPGRDRALVSGGAMAVMAHRPELDPTRVRTASAGPRLRLAAIDVWTLAYTLIASLMLARHWLQPLPARGWLVAAHVLVLATVLLAARLRETR